MTVLIVTSYELFILFELPLSSQPETHFFEFLENNDFGKLTHTLESLLLSTQGHWNSVFKNATLPDKEPLFNSKRRASDFNFRKEKYLYGRGEKAHNGQLSKVKRNHLQDPRSPLAQAISTHSNPD